MLTIATLTLIYIDNSYFCNDFDFFVTEMYSITVKTLV